LSAYAKSETTVERNRWNDAYRRQTKGFGKNAELRAEKDRRPGGGDMEDIEFAIGSNWIDLYSCIRKHKETNRKDMGWKKTQQ